MNSLTIYHQSWPIEGSFAISRGSKTTAEVVVAEISDGQHRGRGECVPYARYGESIDSVIAQIKQQQTAIENGMTREQLQDAMPAGAARNAIDCAYWDLEAKQAGKRAWQASPYPNMLPITTAYTLSLDTPEAMQKKAAEHAAKPLLKLKLAGPGDLARVQAVRRGSPNAKLIVDANEGWTVEIYQELAPQLLELGVELIEQPLPAADDHALMNINRPIPLCADESAHDRKSLADIVGKYDYVNIKLDKTGGLTEALAMRKEAQAAGLKIMVGSMLASSLAMAPAMVVAFGSEIIVDLDSPLLLAKDQPNGIVIDKTTALMPQPSPLLWG